MKIVRLIFSLLVMVLFIQSCKKEHAPVSTTGTPEFYFNGSIAGVSTSLNAGVNNYYMYSSYVQDSNNIYDFIGDLKQTASNLNSIQIQINNYKASALNAPINIDSALMVGYYNYYIPGTTTTTTTTTTSTVYQVQFNSAYTNGTAQTYNWNFGDGTTSTVANPTHIYSQLSYYNVCLNITGANSCSSNICDTVNLTSPSSYSCHATLSSTVVAGTNVVNFGSTATGTAPFKYSWDFGDSALMNNSDSASVMHNYANAGTYQVSLHIKDSTGNISVAKYKVTTATAPATCLTNFSVSNIQAVTTTTTFTVGPNIVLGLGDVIVIWTDASGNIYTSKNNAQPSSSGFQIVSIDNYSNNANNQHTKKLHVKFSCTVYNSNRPAIQITNADAVITVAYK
jgi:PKD repeat protein